MIKKIAISLMLLSVGLVQASNPYDANGNAYIKDTQTALTKPRDNDNSPLFQTPETVSGRSGVPTAIDPTQSDSFKSGIVVSDRSTQTESEVSMTPEDYAQIVSACVERILRLQKKVEALQVDNKRFRQQNEELQKQALGLAGNPGVKVTTTSNQVESADPQLILQFLNERNTRK